MSSTQGTPPNTSLVLTSEELAFIEAHGLGKSEAVHKGLALLMKQMAASTPTTPTTSAPPTAGGTGYHHP